LTTSVFQGALFAAVAGFLTRPCCVVPTALSLAGLGSAGLSALLVTYRPLFLGLSGLALVASTWMTFRRTGGLFNRWVAIVSSVIAFFISAGFTGAFDVF